MHHDSIAQASAAVAAVTQAPTEPSRQGAQQHPPAVREALAFILQRADNALVSLVNACAMDDSSYWEVLFELGAGKTISEDRKLESEFLTRMCDKPGLPHAAKLVDAYLSLLDDEHKERLFAVSALRQRSYHLSQCFYGASFASDGDGAHLLAVLKVLVRHGMPLQTLVNRNLDEVVRATMLRHVPFLSLILASGARFPSELYAEVLERTSANDRDIAILAMLIDECKLPLAEVLADKAVGAARPQVKGYLTARSMRDKRVPRTNINPEEEDYLEPASS